MQETMFEVKRNRMESPETSRSAFQKIRGKKKEKIFWLHGKKGDGGCAL